MATGKKFFKLCTPLINNANFLFNRSTLSGCYQSQVTFCTRLSENINGIPPRPKRPLNPFIRFSIEERPKIIAENPGIPNNKVLNLLSQRWAEYNTEQKQSLQQAYRQEMDLYVKEIIEYESLLTDEQKKMIKEAREKKLLMKKKNAMKSKLEELGKPKKPPSIFISYLISKKNLKKDKVPYTEWVKEVSEEWANLSPDIKEKYAEEHKKLMDQYRHNIIEWEEKMVKLGHTGFVRKKILLDLKDKEVPK
ncbi:transcription factor A, mitochondrial [Chelonus insularis]|uniref:transcription factor A, mitochondrial n=1 Tax=Chelonus insularis TaxID=460826 RepID=UPI00158D16D2|nr:transcription factor A, mitochondrial [Chelonus insularis]